MNQDTGKLQFSNFFSKSADVSKMKESLSQDTEALRNFAQEVRKTGNAQEVFDSMSNTMSADARKWASGIANVASNEQMANDRINQYATQRANIIKSYEESSSKLGGIANKLKGFGANLLTGLVSGGIVALASWGIDALIQGIDHLANADRDAAKQADDVTNSYKQQEDTFRNNTSTLQGLKSQYDELSKGVDSAGNNVNLSTEQYKQYHDIVNQIVEIEPSLAAGYDSEGNAILTRNDALEQGINLQQQALKLKQQEQTEGKDADTTWNGYVSGYKNDNKNYTGDSVNSAAGHEYDQVSGVAKSFFEAFNYSNDGMNVNSTLDSIDKIKKAFSGVGLDYDKITNGNLIETEKLVSKRQELINKLTKENNLTAEQKKQVNDIISGVQKENSAKEIAVKKETDFLDTWVSSSDSTKWYQDMSKNGVANIFNSQISNYLKNNPKASLDEAKQKAQDLGNAYESIKDKLPTKEFKTFADAVKNGDVTQKQEQDANKLVQTWRKNAEDFKKKGKTDVADVITAITDGYAQEVQSANEVIDSNNQAANSFTSLADAEKAARSGLTQAQESFDSYSSGLSELIKLQQSTGTGSSLDPTAYKKLTTDLPDIDFSKAVEYHNGGMQFNLDELQKVTKAYADEQEAANSADITIEKINYEENAQQIAAYSKEIETNTYAQGENKDSVQGKIDSLQQEQNTIQNNIQQYEILNAALEESTSNYAKWQNAQKARDSGDMFTDTSSAKKQITEGLKNGKVGSQKFQAAVEFLIPDTFEPKDQKRVQDYLSKLNRYITEDSKGNVTAEGMQNFMSDMVTKGFAKQDDNGKYQLVGKHTMSEIAKGMNITPDMAKSIFGNLEDYGFKFKFEEEDPTKNLTKDFDNVKKQIDEINSNSTLTPKVKSEQLTQAYSELYKLNQLKNKTFNNTSNIKIQAEIEVDSQIETAQKKVDDLKKKVQSSSGTAKITATADLGNAQKELNQLKQTKDSLDKPTVAEINLQINQNNDELKNLKSNLAELKKNPKDAKVVQQLMVQYKISDTSESDAKQVQDYIQGKITSIQKETQNLQEDLKIHFAADTTAVDSANTKVKDEYNATKAALEGHPLQIQANNSDALNKINSTKAILDSIPNQKDVNIHVGFSIGTPTTNGKAGANGNATDALSGMAGQLLSGSAGANGNAHANGTWGETVGGKTLVGELGSEIVVDPMTGKWHTVGDNGAEFVNIPRGAIVFNHVQTKDILENGYVTSRGTITNALANGNAHVNGTALVSGNAMVTGGGYLPSSNPAVSGYYEGDSGDTSSKKKNTEAKKKNTAATKENTAAKKENADASKQENKALDDYNKLLSHQKNMGQYDSLQGQLQYIQKLQYALNHLAKSQEEKWQLQEEIYSAQKAYEEDALKTQEDVISHNESLGKYTGNLVQKYKDLVNVQKQYAKTEEQRKKIDEELYGIQKDIIQQQEDAEKHLVSTGKAAENTLDYVRWIDAEIQRINNTKGLSSGDKKSLTDSLREERYSNMKGYEQSVLDTSLNQELGFREKMGTVGEGTKEALQNYQEIYKNLTTGKNMTLVNNIQNQQEIESDIYSTKKNILESQKTELDNEVSLGNVRENSLEYVQGILKYKQSIEQSDLGAYDKEQALLGVNKDLYSAEKNYVQLLESSLSDESIVGSYGYRMKQIQDQIDAINQQNDSLSKQIALEKAKAAFEEAKNQKSVSIYRQGYGFVYQADQKNVNEKGQALEDAKREKQIQDLTDQKNAIEKEMNAQKDALENSLKSLNGYKNDSISSWDKISKQVTACITDINSALGIQTQTAQQNYRQQESDLHTSTTNQKTEYDSQIDNQTQFNKEYKKGSALTEGINNTLVDSFQRVIESFKQTSQSLIDLGNSYLQAEQNREAANDEYNSYNQSQAEAAANGNQFAQVAYYASGTNYARGGMAVKNEHGYELMLSPTPDGDYGYVPEGSKILTADKTNRLFQFADNPQAYISSSIADRLSNIKISGGNNASPVVNHYSWDKLVLPNVTEGNEFVSQLQESLQRLDLDAMQTITKRNK